MKNLKIGMVQQSCTPDRNATIDKSLTGIRTAAAQGAELVVLQELHCGPYFCQTEDTSSFDLAETIPGPATEQFGAIARELGVVIVTSLFERRAPGLYHNTAVVFEKDGSIAGKYRKMHIPDDPGFLRKVLLHPRRPRLQADQDLRRHAGGTGMLGPVVPRSRPHDGPGRGGSADLPDRHRLGPNDTDAEKERQLDAWVTMQRGHAVANGMPVIRVNRVGFEADPSKVGAGIDFWGNSFVAGPQGELLVQGNNDKEDVLVVEMDGSRSENVRRIWPFLRDRRIDAYEDLLKRYRD